MKKMQNAKFKIQILLLALLLFSVSSVQAQGVFENNSIPAPPQSVRLEERKERTEVNQVPVVGNITHYQSSLNPELIVAFYKQHLPQRGWELLGERAKGPVGIAVFAKGQENVSISAYSLKAGTTDIYISRSKTPKVDSLPQREKGQDVLGQDIVFAPRYPNAVRTLYQQNKQTGVTMVGYGVDAEPNKIIQFYQRKLTDNGWVFVKDVRLAQLPGIGAGSFVTLFFKSAQGRCQVSINRADDFQDLKTTAVVVNYMPRGAQGRMR